MVTQTVFKAAQLLFSVSTENIILQKNIVIINHLVKEKPVFDLASLRL